MTEQAIQHIKYIQESTGFIEDIISNNPLSFRDEFLKGTYPIRIDDIVFDSGCITVYDVRLDNGFTNISYEQLTNWINSI